MLAALWRESPLPELPPGRRLATMAALLHVDAAGRLLAGALIDRSGLAPGVWLRRYLDAYLVPLLHAFYAHDLVFMPHGESVILVLRDGLVERVILKDIAEEIAVLDPAAPLPPEVARLRADYQSATRQLAGRFRRYDLFAPTFSRSCLNRLQLRDNQQMVDLADPAGALQLVGELTNPIARCAPSR